MKIMKHIERISLVLGLGLSLTLLVACQQQTPTQTSPSPTSITPTQQPSPATLSSPILQTTDELTWADAPSSLPAGAKIAIIEGGGLKNTEPFTFRLLLPPNYKIAPHTHPAIEHVTVLSGTLYFSDGKEYSPDTAKAYPAGSVMFMPIGHAMFGFTKDEETIIQIHGTGPWGIEYINPTDDPRKA